MVKVATFFAMSLGAFVFWQTMDKIHVWIALHQDEKEVGFSGVGISQHIELRLDSAGPEIADVLFEYYSPLKERMEKEAEIRRMRVELLRQNKERDSLL